MPGFRTMSNRPENWVANLDNALKGAGKIGVSPVLESRDIANPNVEYLGVMAWAAAFQWIPDKNGPGDLVEVKCYNDAGNAQGSGLYSIQTREASGFL